jgi:hypothetical protein
LTHAAWALWNARLLAVFGPILIVTGVAGFLIPPRRALMSGAPPYNVFHIVFGVVGTALCAAGHARGIATFNLAFGVGDLYQAAAGVLGLYPSRLFRYKPADHVVHLLLGLLLAGVGWMGLRP